MTAGKLPPGWRYGRCDWCGKPCIRPKAAGWYPCWRSSCHSATRVRIFAPSDPEGTTPP